MTGSQEKMKMSKHSLASAAFAVILGAFVVRSAVPAVDVHLLIACAGIGLVLWLVSVFQSDKPGAEVMAVLTAALHDAKQPTVVNAVLDSVKRERDELRKNVDYLKQQLLERQKRLEFARTYNDRVAKGAADANRAVRRYKDKLERVKATATRYRDLIVEMASTMDVHTMFWPPLVDKVLEVVEYKIRRKEDACAAAKLVEPSVQTPGVGHSVPVARCSSGRCCRNRPAAKDS
jgi:hypothetical protein